MKKSSKNNLLVLESNSNAIVMKVYDSLLSFFPWIYFAMIDIKKVRQKAPFFLCVICVSDEGLC